MTRSISLEHPDPDDAAVQALAARMARDGLNARPDPIDPALAILMRRRAGTTLGAGRVALAMLDRAVALGLLVRSGRQEFAVPAAADNGRDTGQDPAPRINDAESPLHWLHVRKGQDGRPLIDRRCFLASERLRADITQAAMLPSVTTNWSRLEASTGRSLPRDPALASDAVVSARQRVRAVYRLIGTEMGDFLLDVCGFLTPLQEAERRRAWPPRAGKLVLRLALSQLAEHYGIGDEAVGRERGAVAGWRDNGARADMQAWLGDSERVRPRPGSGAHPT